MFYFVSLSISFDIFPLKQGHVATNFDLHSDPERMSHKGINKQFVKLLFKPMFIQKLFPAFHNNDDDTVQ